MLPDPIKVLIAANDRNMFALDLSANNLANAGTAGFKADRPFSIPRPEAVKKGFPVQNLFDNIRKIDFSQGGSRKTDNPLDLAIEGKGFFTVLGKDGEQYTRKGSFILDKDRRLVTTAGLPVLGETGIITLPPGRLEINARGDIIVNGISVARLKITTFDDENQLYKISDSAFGTPDPKLAQKAENYQIQTGYLETSNVEVMKEMVAMIEQQRRLELFQKAVHTIADLDKIATSRIGRLT